MRIAAIDVGSNSIHMVIAQVESGGRFRVLDRAKEMVRLGRRSLNNGRLSCEAMTLGLRTLAAFRTLAERQGVVRFNAVATSAVRETSNGGDFIQRVKDDVGLRVKVIPGREEARLVYLGVRHAIDLRQEPTLIVDVGGGSIELILVDEEKPVALHSLKVGVARLSEKFLHADPPTGKDLAQLTAYVEEKLQPILSRVAKRSVRRVVGTSGTLLNVRWLTPLMAGNRNQVVEIARVRRLLVKLDHDERLRIKGLDAKRVDLIVAGACLAECILRLVGAEELVACTWALREGVRLDFIARHPKGIEETERFADPRRRSMARLARHLGETGEHGPHVAHLALQLFDRLQDDLALPDETREWLECAAWLHDVGHHIGHKDHQRHSYYLITNGEFLGFRREELQIIGLTARYHQKAPPKDADDGYAALSKADRRTVRALSAVLRLADGLDRSHYGVVRNVCALRRNGRLMLQLETPGDDAALEIWEGQRRAGLLAEVLRVEVDFQVVAARDGEDIPRSAAGPRQRSATAAAS